MDLFARHHDRLKRMVRLRLDRRLQGRVDPSDVLRQVSADVGRRASEYAASPTWPAYLWLRSLAGERLQQLGGPPEKQPPGRTEPCPARLSRLRSGGRPDTNRLTFRTMLLWLQHWAEQCLGIRDGVHAKYLLWE